IFRIRSSTMRSSSSSLIIFLLSNLIIVTLAGYYEDAYLGPVHYTHGSDAFYRSCGVELLEWAQNVCDSCEEEMIDHVPVTEPTPQRAHDLERKKIAELCCMNQCSRREIRQMCCF
ncbi:hypothetical protein PFISCL1PPCAC_26904, partial [Pristionchus fissidentatus]